MDEAFEQDLAASRSKQAEMLDDLTSDDEDDVLDAPVHIKESKSSTHEMPKENNDGPDVQKVIRISQLEKGAKAIATSDSIENPLRERKMKRKAEEDLRTDGVKHSTSPTLAVGMSSASSSGLISPPQLQSCRPSAVPPKLEMVYPNGALRITRTPGRQKMRNCVNLEDVIHKEHLVSACIFSFFVADDELFEHLPLSHSSDAVPIYIGRDPNNDPLLEGACSEAGMTLRDDRKLAAKQLPIVSPILRRLHQQRDGENLLPFYAWCGGSSHSKILLLLYPTFLRIVITSCNMMNIDTVQGDNHWYIHDVPKAASCAKGEPSAFESGLLEHLQALSTPAVFIDSVRGMYDYSTVKVHLITCVPNACAGARAEKHGLLRLRRIVQDLNLGLSSKARSDEGFQLEICTASLGNLSAKWLNRFHDCALGAESIGVDNEDPDVPNIKLIYPTVADVKNSHPKAKEAASNIGCHIRPWNKAPEAIKNIFHHYQSKDSGWLFHQKLILAYNRKDTTTPPYYVYVGSANLSASAWGTLEQDKSKSANDEACKLKLKGTNFECGVVVPGHLIDGLLEKGTKNWLDGIVPYVQTTEKYDLKKDRPWNDPRWNKDYQENWKGV